MKRWRTIVFPTTFILLEFATLAAAHGEEGANQTITAVNNSTDELHLPPTSYLRHPKHVTLILAHIALMIVGWVFALPVGKPATVQKFHEHFID
jgi:hypothetical protein